MAKTAESIGIRVDSEVLREVEAMATRWDVSRSALIGRYIEQGLAADANFGQVVTTPAVGRIMKAVMSVAVRDDAERQRVLAALQSFADWQRSLAQPSLPFEDAEPESTSSKPSGGGPGGCGGRGREAAPRQTSPTPAT